VKTSDAERIRNRSYRSHLRQAIKEVRSETNKDEASRKLRIATSIIDKAASYKLIHKKTASRNKSRLAQYVGKLG
jgi:small subunit ribosomal protein S20